jgi:peptidoglycan/xylan/chitin deacetylase (PgdA/CDA1 family)
LHLGGGGKRLEAKLNSTRGYWAKKSLMTSGLLRLAGRFKPTAAIILMYHSVRDNPQDCADSIGTANIHAAEKFRKQMEVLARNYNPVTVEDIRLYLAGERKVPKRPVVVTFDDGYADNFEVAAPVMNRLGIPGSFYLTAASVDTGRLPWFCNLRHALATTRKRSWVDSAGRTWTLNDDVQRAGAFAAECETLTQLAGSVQQEALRAIETNLDVEPFVPSKRLMMTWEQARKLREGGHVVGSHSLTHPNLAYVPDHELMHELTESKSMMERELPGATVHFAYPAAALAKSWTEQTVAACRQAGYESALTTARGLARRGDDPLALRRIGAADDVQMFCWDLEWASFSLS